LSICNRNVTSLFWCRHFSSDCICFLSGLYIVRFWKLLFFVLNFCGFNCTILLLFLVLILDRVFALLCRFSINFLFSLRFCDSFWECFFLLLVFFLFRFSDLEVFLFLLLSHNFLLLCLSNLFRLFFF
jgi:hypothetical protein